MGDWQTDCCSITSDLDTLLDLCGAERAECESEAVNWLVSLCFTHFYGYMLCDWKNEIADTGSRFLHWVSWLLFRNRKKLCHSGGTQNRALPHTESRQLRWFGHLDRMVSSSLLSESFCPTGRRLGSRLKMSWTDYISWLEEVSSQRDIYVFRLLTPQCGFKKEKYD